MWSLRYGEHAPRNPWGATGLEWQTSSPPPKENFEHVPTVQNDPYEYHEKGKAPEHGASIHRPQGGGDAKPEASQ
jgi:cytochrome c oxidase subunit 1